MDRVYAELCDIVDAADAVGAPVVVIGAFAVRAYLARPDRRLTHDMDLFVAEGTRERLRGLLEARGYRVYSTGPWWRAERGAGELRHVVDIAVDAVVDVASFNSYPLDPADSRRRAEPGGPPLPVPAVEDVVALKLLAHRDKDVLDLVALMRDTDHVDRDELGKRVSARDLETAVRRGYLEVVAAAESGQLAELWARRSNEPLPAEELARALARLHDLCR